MVDLRDVLEKEWQQQVVKLLRTSTPRYAEARGALLLELDQHLPKGVAA